MLQAAGTLQDGVCTAAAAAAITRWLPLQPCPLPWPTGGFRGGAAAAASTWGACFAYRLRHAPMPALQQVIKLVLLAAFMKQACITLDSLLGQSRCKLVDLYGQGSTGDNSTGENSTGENSTACTAGCPLLTRVSTNLLKCTPLVCFTEQTPNQFHQVWSARQCVRSTLDIALLCCCVVAPYLCEFIAR